MNNKKIIIGLSILFFSNKLVAQSNADFSGIWKGTSVCQVKNSPCHDETVVYHISKPGSSNLFQVDAGKMVNGKEEDMGELTFTYDSLTQKLVSTDTERDAVWSFTLKEKKMEGTLVYKQKLFRIINLIKE